MNRETAVSRNQNELVFRANTNLPTEDTFLPGRRYVSPRTAVLDLLLIAEVVAQRAVGLLRAAQLPAAGFLICLLACLRLAGGPQAAD